MGYGANLPRTQQQMHGAVRKRHPWWFRSLRVGAKTLAYATTGTQFLTPIERAAIWALIIYALSHR